MIGKWVTDTSLLVIGGGYDLGFIHALGDDGTKTIRDYVHNGGRYLGLCAGGYFGCDYVEFDKGGPMEVCGSRQLKFYRGKYIIIVNTNFLNIGYNLINPTSFLLPLLRAT